MEAVWPLWASAFFIYQTGWIKQHKSSYCLLTAPQNSSLQSNPGPRNSAYSLLSCQYSLYMEGSFSLHMFLIHDNTLPQFRATGFDILLVPSTIILKKKKGIFLNIFYLLIFEREKHQWLFHSFMHSLVDCYMCPDQGLNTKLWLISMML